MHAFLISCWSLFLSVLQNQEKMTDLDTSVAKNTLKVDLVCNFQKMSLKLARPFFGMPMLKNPFLTIRKSFLTDGIVC